MWRRRPRHRHARARPGVTVRRVRVGDRAPSRTQAAAVLPRRGLSFRTRPRHIQHPNPAAEAPRVARRGRRGGLGTLHPMSVSGRRGRFARRARGRVHVLRRGVQVRGPPAARQRPNPAPSSAPSSRSTAHPTLEPDPARSRSPRRESTMLAERANESGSLSHLRATLAASRPRRPPPSPRRDRRPGPVRPRPRLVSSLAARRVGRGASRRRRRDGQTRRGGPATEPIRPGFRANDARRPRARRPLPRIRAPVRHGPRPAIPTRRRTRARPRRGPPERRPRAPAREDRRYEPSRRRRRFVSSPRERRSGDGRGRRGRSRGPGTLRRLATRARR